MLFLKQRKNTGHAEQHFGSRKHARQSHAESQRVPREIRRKGVPSENGAGACGTVSGPNEVAVGIAQWTTIPGGCNNIKDLCAWLYEQDPSFCAPLRVFGTYSESQIVGSLDSLKAAWKQVNESDTDRFLELQMQYFYEVEYMGWLEQFHTEWLLDKDLVTQGTYRA